MAYDGLPMQSRITEFGSSDDYELSYLPPAPAALRDSKSQRDIEFRGLLVDTNTSYDSSYANSATGDKFSGARLKNSTYANVARATNTTLSSVTNWIDQRHAWRYVRLKLNLGVLDEALDNAQHPHRGWRTAVIVAASITSFVLIVNTIFAIVMAVKYPAKEGVGLIYEGDCGLVHRWDTAIHLAINVFGTMLLAASSFTMQCLSSPTRSEIDAAHAKRKSMDIGLASFKNLFHMKKYKSVLWLGLCLSTLPLHLMWNSTVFSTDSVSYFNMVVADEAFLSGADYQQSNVSHSCDVGTRVLEYTSLDTMRSDYAAGNYTRLSAAECFNAYNVNVLANRRNLIVITTPVQGQNMSQCNFNGGRWNGSSVLRYDANVDPAGSWIFDITNGYGYNTAVNEQLIKNNGTWFVGPWDSFYTPAPANSTSFLWPVNYCYSETRFYGGCQLQYVSYILYIVVICNVIKVICMVAVAHYLWDLNEPILATIGDAVSSFIERADISTADWCLLSRASLSDIQFQDKWLVATRQAIYNRKPKTRLYSATSGTRWWWTIILCTLYLILGIVLCVLSVGLYGSGDPFQVQWAKVDQSMTLGLDAESGSGLIRDIVIANSFQLALSTTYFLYNSLYTAQCAALEWASYVQGKRKTLRVTWPHGQQRSTYYLQLPYRYGIPLTLLLMLMHFLISQSIFLARSQYYSSGGEKDVSSSFSDVGYSTTAIVVTCGVGFLMIVAQVVNSLRPLDNRIPIHGNSSLVISAMCHVNTKDGGFENDGTYSTPKIRPEGIVTKPLTWGVTRRALDESIDINTATEKQIRRVAGHCSFTEDVVELPERGKLYL